MYLIPNLTALKTPQPNKGRTTSAVDPNPSKIPCSKNPIACPGFWPVGFSCFKASSISFEAGGRGVRGMINCGWGVENMSDVYRG